MPPRKVTKVNKPKNSKPRESSEDSLDRMIEEHVKNQADNTKTPKKNSANNIKKIPTKQKQPQTTEDNDNISTSPKNNSPGRIKKIPLKKKQPQKAEVIDNSVNTSRKKSRNASQKKNTPIKTRYNDSETSDDNKEKKGRMKYHKEWEDSNHKKYLPWIGKSDKSKFHCKCLWCDTEFKCDYATGPRGHSETQGHKDEAAKRAPIEEESKDTNNKAKSSELPDQKTTGCGYEINRFL